MSIVYFDWAGINVCVQTASKKYTSDKTIYQQDIIFLYENLECIWISTTFWISYMLFIYDLSTMSKMMAIKTKKICTLKAAAKLFWNIMYFINIMPHDEFASVKELYKYNTLHLSCILKKFWSHDKPHLRHNLQHEIRINFEGL